MDGNTLIVRMTNLFLAQRIMMSASACHDTTVKKYSTEGKGGEKKNNKIICEENKVKR